MVKNMTKILNFGSLNIDYVYSMDHFVQPGETTSSLDRNVFAGGKGLNQSIACKRAGALVYHAGAVGKNDSKVLISTLKSDDINLDYIKYLDEPSGHTVIQVNKEGQNCIILFGGSNQAITKEHIDATLANFEKGDFLILQNEINNIEYLINEGYRRGLKICFNVSPFVPELLKLPLEKCSYLIVNEIEGSSIAGMSVDSKPEDLISALASQFPHTNIVLTLGVHGSYFKEEAKDPIFVNSFKVKAIDTTAAGDTYLGYLMAMLSKNAEPKQALELAAAASALAVTKKGACSSIPYLSEVEKFLKELK